MRPAGPAEAASLRAFYLRRMVVLGVIITGIMLAVLLNLGPHLIQTHWKVTPYMPGWFDRLNFMIFDGLVGGTLLLLSHRLRPAPARVIRGLNIGLGIAALLFVFFSRSQVQHAYLYSVEVGYLTFADLLSYLQLDLFFAPPWLGVYLLIYPLPTGCWRAAATSTRQWGSWESWG